MDMVAYKVCQGNVPKEAVEVNPIKTVGPVSLGETESPLITLKDKASANIINTSPKLNNDSSGTQFYIGGLLPIFLLPMGLLLHYSKR